MKYSKFVTIIATLIILFFSLISNLGFSTYPFEHSDKLKHILAFFVLSYFFYKSFENIKNIYKFFVLVFFAFIIEFLQLFTNRESSIMDFLSSVLGVLLFILFFRRSLK